MHLNPQVSLGKVSVVGKLHFAEKFNDASEIETGVEPKTT